MDDSIETSKLVAKRSIQTAELLVDKKIKAVEIIADGKLTASELVVENKIKSSELTIDGSISSSKLDITESINTNSLNSKKLTTDDLTVNTRLIAKDAVINGDFEVSASTVLKSDAEIEGSLYINGETTLSSDASISGTLTVYGAVMGSGPYIDSSDERYKTNIKPVTGALESIKKINGYTYHLKNNEFPKKKFETRQQVGWLAGEVKNVAPELVYEDSDGYSHVAYGRASTLVASAVQELSAEVLELRQELKNLRKLVQRCTA